MNELALSLPTQPDLKLSTLPTEFFKEEFVDILIAAGLSKLENISFPEFENSIDLANSCIALEPYFFALCLKAYAEKNNLIIHKHLVYKRTVNEYRDQDILFASRTVPTTYLNIKKGEEVEQLLKCFALKATDLFEKSTLAYVQFENNSSRYPFNLRISRTAIQVDCDKYLPKGFMDYLQDRQFEFALKIAKRKPDSYADNDRSDASSSVYRVEQLQSDLKAITADGYPFVDFGFVDEINSLLPVLLTYFKDQDARFIELNQKEEERQSTLFYKYCYQWDHNSGNMIGYHIVAVAIFILIGFLIHQWFFI